MLFQIAFACNNFFSSVHCFNAFQNNGKCIDLEVSYYMRCKTKIERSKLKSRNKREIDEPSCAKFKIASSNIPYRLNEDISSEPNINPDLLNAFGMTRLYNKTCSYSTFYRRLCGHLKQYNSDSITADECLTKCLENEKCHRAQYYPGNFIWAGNDNPVCFLFPLGVRDCRWNGGETMSSIDPVIKSQIKMIECTRPQCVNNEDTCLHANSQGTWFDSWCDYNWLYDKGLYHYECKSCEPFVEPEDCKNSVSCLSSCFGIFSFPVLQARLRRPEPEDSNLPSDYAFVLTTWGSFFYKYYDNKVTMRDAQNLCRNDNASLPIPLSKEENKFLLTLGMRYDWEAVEVMRSIWLGIITFDQVWTTLDGNTVNWFNWMKNRPQNSLSDELAVVLFYNEEWMDLKQTQKTFVVCWKIYERYTTD